MVLQDNLWKVDHDIHNEIHLHYVLLESRSVQVNCLTTAGFHHSAHMPPPQSGTIKNSSEKAV